MVTDSETHDMYDDDAFQDELRTTWDNAVALVLGCAFVFVALCLLGCIVGALVAWI